LEKRKLLHGAAFKSSQDDGKRGRTAPALRTKKGKGFSPCKRIDDILKRLAMRVG